MILWCAKLECTIENYDKIMLLRVFMHVLVLDIKVHLRASKHLSACHLSQFHLILLWLEATYEIVIQASDSCV